MGQIASTHLYIVSPGLFKLLKCLQTNYGYGAFTEFSKETKFEINIQ